MSEVRWSRSEGFSKAKTRYLAALPLHREVIRQLSVGSAWAAVLLSLMVAACAGPDPEAGIRQALQATSGTLRLPAGVVNISSELIVRTGTRGLRIVGHPAGTVLRAADSFQGRAILVCLGAEQVELRDFTIDGNRATLARPIGLPPHVDFAGFYSRNGVLADNVTGLTITNVVMRNVSNFPILVANSKHVRINRVTIEDSGSRNEIGRNNTSGGILLEEGTSDFVIEDCTLRNVLGNGIWTHSLYESPRNRNGRILRNSFDNIGRDAVQIGHAVDVLVEGNSGRKIGYPAEAVDVEGGGFPAAIDTAGNVERCAYRTNRFEEVNGKCIDLDGFHHGEVSGNVCVNRSGPEAYPHGNFGIAMNNTNPDMRSEDIRLIDNEIDGALYSGMLVIGTGHVIRGNRLRNLNLAHCYENQRLCAYKVNEEPEFLGSGIYLGRGAERPDPARANRIQDNEISGFGIDRHCIVAAPGVSLRDNRIEGNRCAGTGGESRPAPSRSHR